VIRPLARELFDGAFVSCWLQMGPDDQRSLCEALEVAMRSESTPLDVLKRLLSLAEFMEHDNKPLSISIEELGDLAQQCEAYAKALHYREVQWHQGDVSCVDDLISIYN